MSFALVSAARVISDRNRTVDAGKKASKLGTRGHFFERVVL